MPAYTLYYFNGRGRAEILRMIFNVAGAQFTDKRFEFNEWDKIRNDMPSSSVPVLEIDGKNKMPETMAIARYLAREYGFHGKNNMDMFRVDYICDCLYEIMHDYMRYFHEKNGRFRETMHDYTRYYHWKNRRFRNGSNDKSDMSGEMQRSYMETCRRILPFLEKTLEMRNGGNQFFMGDQMMLCDMMLYCFLENPMVENQAMFNSYPKLMALWKRVAAHPKVSGYLKKRSNTNW